METRYPGYGFAKHKGYPTREHLAAIASLGVTPEHRRSFGPIKRLLLAQSLENDSGLG
jgi:ribonuclease HII